MCIGQTGISLKYRLKGHWHTLRNDEVAASALAEHTVTAGHGIDLSKAEAYEVVELIPSAFHTLTH